MSECGDPYSGIGCSDPDCMHGYEPARPVGGDTREKGRLVLGVVGELPDGPDLGTPAPAGPTDTREALREEIARALETDLPLWARLGRPRREAVAVAVLALPTVRAALDAQETMRRVEALADDIAFCWDDENTTVSVVVAALRRALDGDR